MSRLARRARRFASQRFVHAAFYEGSQGTAWVAGDVLRPPSVAAFFCGDDVRRGPGSRVTRQQLLGQVLDVAKDGGLPIVQVRGSDRAESVSDRAIQVPSLVDVHTDLPGDQDTLHSQLLTSTTKEDFRRIRKANFSYRVTTDPDSVTEFHQRHYSPLVAHQYPDDGRIIPLTRMLEDLGRGGELICADIEDQWVAGIYNVSHGDRYALMSLGIRDADRDVRQKRVVAALIVRSLQRGVELGLPRATLGRSLPFLGKGPVWFKAKWSGVITRQHTTPSMHMFIDLNNAAARRMLSTSPVIHVKNGALAVSKWLENGEKAIKDTVRDAARFPGISEWLVLSEPNTLEVAMDALKSQQNITPVPVEWGGDSPIWLAEVLKQAGGSSG